MVGSSFIAGLSVILVMAEHRDGRFRYEVPSLSSSNRRVDGYHSTTSAFGGDGEYHLNSNHHHRRSVVTKAASRRTTSYNLRSSRNGSSASRSSPPNGTFSWPKRKQPRRRSRSRSRSRSSNSLLTEYTINSTIHGVKYLGGPERPWPERLWWIIMFVISLSVCTALITNTYKKWTQDPVIVTFSQMATPVWRIPFPAVTICPTNIVRQSQFNFTDIITKVQDKDKKLNLTASE